MAIPDFDKVELLLPMTGANNGTDFPDFSLRKRTVTRVGAVTSTAQTAFAAYGSSGLLNGTSNYLSVPYGSIGTANWCFESWVRLTAVGTANQCIFSKVTNSSSVANSLLIIVLRNNHPTNPRGIFVNGTSEMLAGSGIIQDATWHHLAVSTEGGTTRAFVDGINIGTKSISHNITDASVIDIGAQISSGTTRINFFGGHMQDACITIGAAKYTANFSPPPRMTARTITRTNSGTDSHAVERAVLFDWGAHGILREAIPDIDGDFVVADLIDLEYGVALIRAGCDPVCRGPVAVDPD